MKIGTQIFTAMALLIVMISSSCVPQKAGSGSRKTSSAGSDSSNNSDVGDANTPSFTTNVSWYSGNQDLDSTLTVNEDVATVVYLRGESIQNFLSTNTNMSLQYCIVTNYVDSVAKKQLRTRAVPISFFNFATNTQEKLLRVDLPEGDTNSSACSGTSYYLTSGTPDNSTPTAGSGDAAFAPSDLCVGCNKTLFSSTISIYSSSPGVSTTNLVPAEQLDLSGLSLRVDTSASVSDPIVGVCSDDSCKINGFDCCLSGQCVKDGALRTDATSQPDYLQALADVASNPSNFSSWPNVYFVCGSNVVPQPTPTALPDPQGTADAILAEQIKMFNCLEEGKKEFPDFTSANVCEPTFDQTAYEAVRSEVWQQCGCSATPFPTDPNDPVCPDYGLKAITNLAGTITQIECDVPPPLADPTPFQAINVSVPSRSAPHRYFKAVDGTSVDDITVSFGGEVVEGEEFSYLDESGKTDPVNGSFNMNSVLGQFSLELTKARPAKTINVEFDQTYVISTNSGFYSPCPQCAFDSWFQTFTAFPTSTMGTGLQAVGYSTNRQEFGNNSTFGNYEDTSFGRACFLPPTMIPFSHQKNADLQTQRLNRLRTQAALYINGYKRDWYGFNKGALIGSFDGVTWFAIGKGRRVTATSGKLFLAINAPFADLAEPSDTVISITVDNGNSTVAEYDYDPSLDINDARQSTGASCQMWHQCNVDSDCITKLGWEYMCQDTSTFRTKWPKFSVNADEYEDQEHEDADFARILQGLLPAGSNKRCVYRGAGSICKKNFNDASIPANKRKNFACAPNFHCADLSSTEFNSELVRTPNQVEIFLFGQDANVLGRPLSYIGGGKSLPSEVVSNIQYNASIHSTDITDFGVCRPSRSLSGSDFINRHGSRDGSGRTDYISQIGNCSSTSTGTSRAGNCPIFETREDQATAVGDYRLEIDNDVSITQNACGAESKRLNATIFESSFKEIESGNLSSLNSILSPTLPVDACFRRAGSVCHTDLDCSPNRLHAEQAIFFGVNYFGGTQAELEFWQEDLICSQGEEKPFLRDDDFNDYDMTKNLCCREITKNITMYTEDQDGLIADNPASNLGLDVTSFSYDDPTASNRYSRYAVANAQKTTSAQTAPIAEAPVISSATTPKSYQWKTINDTGSATCCGGGWIRKFSDGSHDWTNSNRLNIDPNNFKCLNYTNELPLQNVAPVNVNNYSRDKEKLCLSPADDGCMQVGMPEPDGFRIIPPIAPTRNVNILNIRPITPPSQGGVEGIEVATYAPFEPIPFENASPINPADTDAPYNYFHDPLYTAVSFYLPAYIGADPTNISNIDRVRILYYKEGEDVAGCKEAGGGTNIADTDITANYIVGCVVPTNPTAFASNQWCLASDGGSSNRTIFHANSDSTYFGDPEVDPDFCTYASVEITYRIPNRPGYETSTGTAIPATTYGLEPGNDLYYLTKMAKFELLGIPQIQYEPLYCNTNRENIVPGFFDLSTDTRTDFIANSFVSNGVAQNGTNYSHIYGTYQNNDESTGVTTVNAGTEPSVVYQDKVSLNPVFSASEFTCCQGLGKETSSADKCCSNFAEQVDGVLTCKLPSKTNLNVYFNKFVSSEGIGETLPSGGLVEADFIPETGEPKLNSAVNSKITALGQEFCTTGNVRQGSAFGYFNGQPNNGFYQQNGSVEDSKIYSIVDSIKDEDEDNQTGMSRFLAGYKWDHQFYCE
tara:strand:- start:29515 stop:34623 length:5109 start_codon:yes stop_codon:yes gene_type:complete